MEEAVTLEPYGRDVPLMSPGEASDLQGHRDFGRVSSSG